MTASLTPASLSAGLPVGSRRWLDRSRWSLARPGLIDHPRLRGGLGLCDAVVATFAGVLLVGTTPRVFAVVVGWMVLLRALTAPTARLARPSTTPVWRAATLVCLGCWIAGPALPMTPDRAMLGIAVAVSGSAAARLAARGRRLRVLLVGCDDRAVSALDQTSVGRVRAVDVCAPTPQALASKLAAHARGAVDAVLVVPGPELTGRALQRLAWQTEAAGLPLLVETGIDGVLPSRVAPLLAGHLGMVHVQPARRRGWRLLVKRVCERALALGALVAAAPVLIGIALAVRFDSPGPVLYRQVRVGRDGRTFTMLKFRSMAIGSDALLADDALGNDGAGPLFKLREDPRVTRVGRFLRRYSLDEVPQLINVLRGEMSLVGPRPALPSEVATYDGDPRRRLAVAPGITGLWQVSGRSDLSWNESVRLDLDYVDNWSLGRDLVILARTLGAVLRHEGAY
ncbi:exopolysaccharide biosynthesis polyprenyl glycosylphosphotransferase [Nocardioides sp. BP30]|uniref:sugar transferase n=1 Tax=Nocardioides sp. BP30 TaxID=3036374 RepID=UPI002469ACB7|nr:exopolysaccharide biosynthesis polyprenyl glycosylphosphotransferase [Nocardioides sp. BP30]WGL51774.1 exopolysaccharide biosynthesis polyprenyl glycosylphosphotransferase [Nocardioides sp. BP30]